MAASAKLNAASLTDYRDLQLKRKHKYVIWKIADAEPRTDVVTEIKGAVGKTWKDMVKDLTPLYPRFVTYDHEFETKDGRKTSKIYFFYWCPENCNQMDSVLYTNCLNDVRNGLEAIAQNFTFQKAENFTDLFTEGGAGSDVESEEDFD